jgi:predicted O-linked N-acetylglucosamine transferase (SPINDLY family)
VRLDDPAIGFARSMFLLAYHGLDDRPLRADLARLYRRACPALDFAAPHCRGERKARDGRIRVGIVSSFIHEHTIAKLNLGLVQKLPRDRFEVTVFAVPGKTDTMTQRYREAADRFVVLPPGLWDARAVIADAAQDALIYPEIGMEAVTYMLAFARLAPLQLSTWGHPETTGIDTIDTFLSSRWLEPAGAEACYGERLVRLDALPARPYAPEARLRFERAHFGLADDKHLYACPQTLFKFHPSFDPMLAEILARDDKAQLVLLEGSTPAWAERLAARFRRAGIDVDRQVRFLPPMPLEQYLSLCRIADVVLDTPVFGGGNSTYEAFHQDAVVVTLESEFLRGRISGGMYRKMGLPDLIPADAKAYVELALRVANDHDYRAEQRARIAERRDALYESDDSVRAVAAYLEEAAR